MSALELELKSDSGKNQRALVEVRRMLNAGAAGRDREQVEHHVRELSALGIPPPANIPSLYPVANHLLRHSSALQVASPHTGGEVEYVLIWREGEILVGVGSDHSDFLLEKYSDVSAKNICPNIIANTLWYYAELANHFDEIILSSQVKCDGKWLDYQRDAVSLLLPPSHWIERFGNPDQENDGLVLYSGTISTLGGLKSGSAFRFSMLDPVRRREISHEYSIEVLPAEN